VAWNRSLRVIKSSARSQMMSYSRRAQAAASWLCSARISAGYRLRDLAAVVDFSQPESPGPVGCTQDYAAPSGENELVIKQSAGRLLVPGPGPGGWTAIRVRGLPGPGDPQPDHLAGGRADRPHHGRRPAVAPGAGHHTARRHRGQGVMSRPTPAPAAELADAACQPRARSRLNAALISARWVKACGKLPCCSPVRLICSAYRPRWLA
jgi:hypothetical protein